MIERMKRITVFCQKEKALSVVLSLRDLGLVHIKDVAQKSVESENKERDKSIVLGIGVIYDWMGEITKRKRRADEEGIL